MRWNQRYVTTDFKDELDESKVEHHEFNTPDDAKEYESPFTSTLTRLKQLIEANKNNVTIDRIRKGEKITSSELFSLESILFSDEIEKEKIEKDLGEKLDLVHFIISLMGLTKEKVDQSFANFINKYELTSVQIEFLNTVKLFFTENGELEVSKLYDDPFKRYHSLEIDGVFSESQADELFKIIGEVNELGEGA